MGQYCPEFYCYLDPHWIEISPVYIGRSEYEGEHNITRNICRKFPLSVQISWIHASVEWLSSSNGRTLRILARWN